MEGWEKDELESERERWMPMHWVRIMRKNVYLSVWSAREHSFSLVLGLSPRGAAQFPYPSTAY